MTVEPTASRPVRKMSVSSLLSLICGVLGCIPFVTGALAVLLGVVGFIRTGNPAKKGRWMAIVGLLLGIVSIGGWTLFGGTALLLWKGTEGPRVAAHDYIKASAEKNRVLEKSLTQGFSDDDLNKIEGQVEKHGKFIDTTFNNTDVSNSSAKVSGTAQFDSGSYVIEASLENSGGWKVTSMYLHVDPVGKE